MVIRANKQRQSTDFRWMPDRDHIRHDEQACNLSLIKLDKLLYIFKQVFL